MNKPLIDIQDLQVHFPIKSGLLQKTVGVVKAVDHVSFQIGENETVGLVSPTDNIIFGIFKCTTYYI